MGGAALLTDRRQAIAGCAAALCDLHTVLFQCGSDDLSDLAADLAEVRALCGAQLAAVVAEAEMRGVIDSSQCANTSEWVGEHAWHSRREATTVARTARLLRRQDLARAADAVLTGDVDLGTATVIAVEYDKLAADLRDEAKPVVLEQFLDVGADYGPAGVRRLRQEILARYGENGEFEEHQEKCRRLIDLSPGNQTSSGIWEYQLITDNEGRAVLEAAIGPLSAPRPDPDSGAADLRPVGRRRGEAVIEALRRAVAAGGHVPTSPKALLMVTVTHADLMAGIGDVGPAGFHAGTVLGTRAAGTLLASDTIRKLACDAGIVPLVLGTDGEILDQGRERRLFTTAQVRALWLRDRHCTFDGCDAPAEWADAHHLIHWIDGGATDLDNGALLCGRHHTIVHRDRLAGTLTSRGVVWDRRPGSYRPSRQ